MPNRPTARGGSEASRSQGLLSPLCGPPPDRGRGDRARRPCGAFSARSGWRLSRRRSRCPPPDPRAIAPTTAAAVPVCSRTQRGGFRPSALQTPAALPDPSAPRYRWGAPLEAWPTPRAGERVAAEGTQKLARTSYGPSMACPRWFRLITANQQHTWATTISGTISHATTCSTGFPVSAQFRKQQRALPREAELRHRRNAPAHEDRRQRRIPQALPLQIDARERRSERAGRGEDAGQPERLGDIGVGGATHAAGRPARIEPRASRP